MESSWEPSTEELSFAESSWEPSTEESSFAESSWEPSAEESSREGIEFCVESDAGCESSVEASSSNEKLLCGMLIADCGEKHRHNAKATERNWCFIFTSFFIVRTFNVETLGTH